MPRSRTFLSGLVIAVLAGGIIGLAVAALIGLAQQADWVPSQGTGIGTCVAAGVGFAVAWLLAGRRPEAEPHQSDVAEPVSSPAVPEREEPQHSPAPASDTPAMTARRTAPAGTATAGELLAAGAVLLAGGATTRAEAIEEAGQLLVEAGAVYPEYVAAMQARERASSTHMGNALAIPRGQHDARGLVRRSALAFVRYPAPLDWRGNRVRFVVAIAGVDDADQVRLVSRVAEVFLDDAAVAGLEATDDPDDVVAAFARRAR